MGYFSDQELRATPADYERDVWECTGTLPGTSRPMAVAPADIFTYLALRNIQQREPATYALLCQAAAGAPVERRVRDTNCLALFGLLDGEAISPAVLDYLRRQETT